MIHAMQLQYPLFVCVVIGLSAAMAVASLPDAPSSTPAQTPAQPDAQNSAAPLADQARPVLLLVIEDQHPTITVSWTARGQRKQYTETVPYSAPIGGVVLGTSNVQAYAALGGSRLDTGAGHPKGAQIRLGITKNDSSRAFFAGIDPGTDIDLTIRGVRFNQPVKYHQGTAIMHLKYALGDLKACALPGTARNQYLLSDPNDTLGGRVEAGVNATPGALDGGPGHGEVSIEVAKDDPALVTMHVRVPYALLRHLQDPWKSTLPGTFFEPIHLHAEAEMIPIDAAPLHRDPFVPEVNQPAPDAPGDGPAAKSATPADRRASGVGQGPVRD